MILDNKNQNKKVYEWLNKFTECGKLDIVTGYFTLGALAYLVQQVDKKITRFRLILGDIVNMDVHEDHTIDLLNQDLTVGSVFELNATSKQVVCFLKQEKVLAKTLEPNFCHAKMFLFRAQSDARHNYFVSGSSNLTEAGIGLKKTSNIELNFAKTGDDLQYKELVNWVDKLWKSKEAHDDKTLINMETGQKTTIPFKQYLIEKIESIFKQYTPKDLYFKILWELFEPDVAETQNDPNFNRKIGRLENTVIFSALYEFQRQGVLSLIRMLQKHDGAILADAVGLGKTWSALAVMKFFELQGREIILICPKKLKYNWHRYLKNQQSKFEKDQFDFFIRHHTDMHSDRMNNYENRADKYFINDKPKLFVIDESHNFRNAKTNSYKFFAKEILQKNEDAKILMLSATPINNSLLDIRNQFKLMRKDQTDGFQESHSIRNIDHLFRRAQHAFFEWRKSDDMKIASFIKKLPSDFFRLTDSLTLVRTRALVEKQEPQLKFPKKHKPENIFVTPKKIGNFDNFEELFDKFPQHLSAYQPTWYTKVKENVEKIHDEKQRDRFLVKMLYILLVKRLESSWYAFKETLERILKYHQSVLEKIDQYEHGQKKTEFELKIELELFDGEEEAEELSTLDMSIGKKRPIKIQEIDDADKLGAFKKDLKKDIEAMEGLQNNLQRFHYKLETEKKIPQNHKSNDSKLQTLISKIHKKRKSSKNNNNQKVVIFTVYKSTAFYLFDQLLERGFCDIAVISGDTCKTDSSTTETKNYEPILERFAPYTKLFLEQEWDFESTSTSLSKQEQYQEWIVWLADQEQHRKTYEKIKSPIDILIATDVLSEGQNLQDCDLVVNYDIHWNPVRVVQRMGRIDRLGSPNKEIFGINFWPSDNIDKYLNLKGRIEERMTVMKLTGAEVDKEFTDKFKQMSEDSDFEDKLNERLLKKLQTTWDDIEQNQENLAFDHLSLGNYRADLYSELQEKADLYKQMPKGIYSGFCREKSLSASKGIIALLGFPEQPSTTLHNRKYHSYNLIYINKDGQQIMQNVADVLDFLRYHKDETRFIAKDIDQGSSTAIQPLTQAMQNWLCSQKSTEEQQSDGTIKQFTGREAKNILAGIKLGEKSAIERMKQSSSVDEKYQMENVDLLAWLLVS